MRADEPALLDASGPRRRQGTDRIHLDILPRRQVAVDPLELVLSGITADVGDERCVREAATVLVDRQRMAALLDQRRRPHVVVQGEPASDAWDGEGVPSHRTDRVVHTEIRDLHAARPANQQLLGRSERRGALARHVSGRSWGERYLLPNEPRIPDEIGDASELDRRIGEEIGERAAVMLTCAADQAVSAPQLVDGKRRAAAEQTARADEPDERPRRERAAAESEDVDLVGGRERGLVLIVLDQPVVRGPHVGLETEAKAATGDRIEWTGTDAFEVELQLRNNVFTNTLVAALRRQREVVQDVR